MNNTEKWQTDAKAWTRYWATAESATAGCIPGAPAEVSALFEQRWKAFSLSLTKGASVLDLGTGGGTVLVTARSVREDLDLTGVDYADHLPSSGADIKMLAKVRLEELPFADASVDAITSQFGLEYADQSNAVSELQRVLAPKGTLLIIAHHADSIIVAHNSRRLAALTEMAGKNGLLDRASSVVGQGQQSSRSGRKFLSRPIDKLRRRHPDQGVVNEVARLTERLISLPNAPQQLVALRTEMEHEIGRLSAMRSVALTQAQATALANRIAATHPSELSVISMPGEQTPLAWCIASRET